MKSREKGGESRGGKTRILWPRVDTLASEVSGDGKRIAPCSLHGATGEGVEGDGVMRGNHVCE